MYNICNKIGLTMYITISTIKQVKDVQNIYNQISTITRGRKCTINMWRYVSYLASSAGTFSQKKMLDICWQDGGIKIMKIMIPLTIVTISLPLTGRFQSFIVSSWHCQQRWWEAWIAMIIIFRTMMIKIPPPLTSIC